MSDVRNKLIKYAVHLPVILAFITAFYFLAVNLRIWSLSLAFLYSYAFVYQGLNLIFELMDRKKLAVITGSGITLVLIVMFRDMVLTENILIAFVAFLLLLIIEHPGISRFSWIVVGAALCVSSLMLYEIPKLAAVSIVMLLLYGLSKLICREAEYYMGVVLLIGIITLIIPAKDEPIEWALVKKVVAAADTGLDKSLDEITYFFDVVFNAGTSFAGYSDNARLRGKMTDSPSVELIMSGKSESKMMYLEGGYYNGVDSGGLNDKEKMSSNYNYWFVEFINGMYQAGVDEKTAACYSSIKSSEILYRYMRTADVIRPNNLLWIDPELKNGLDKKKGKGFRYNVRYMQVDYASPYLREYVDSIKDSEVKYHSYSEISEYVKEVYKVNLKDTIREDEYNQAVDIMSSGEWKDKYLDNSFASDRLKELTAQVTEGAETDFEKAKKIESFLRQYTYDTNIDLRGSDNYVDEFLFVTQKGYCVHYASAMLLMLRSAGIPARYVNGFMHEVNESGSVMSSEAHAWPEAYIKGLGWVIFEPTVVKVSAEDIAWGKVRKSSPDETAQSPQDYGYYQEYMDEPEPIDNIPSPVPEEEENTNNKKIDMDMLYQFGMYFLIMIGAVILLICLIKLGIYIHYLRLSPEDKVKLNIRNICKRIDQQIEKKNAEKRAQEKKKKRKHKGYSVEEAGIKGAQVITFANPKEIESIFDYLTFIHDADKKKELKSIFDTYYRMRFRGDIPEKDYIERIRKYKITL